jgi:hypothetical protein
MEQNFSRLAPQKQKGQIITHASSPASGGASHVVTSTESKLKLFFSHHQSSHTFITHTPTKSYHNMPFLTYPGSQQPAAAAIRYKWQVCISVPAK